jgi:hypothetical protein
MRAVRACRVWPWPLSRRMCVCCTAKATEAERRAATKRAKLKELNDALGGNCVTAAHGQAVAAALLSCVGFRAACFERLTALSGVGVLVSPDGIEAMLRWHRQRGTGMSSS